MTTEYKRMIQRNGLSSQLPSPTNGEIYITNDTKEMYFGAGGTMNKVGGNSEETDVNPSPNKIPKRDSIGVLKAIAGGNTDELVGFSWKGKSDYLIGQTLTSVELLADESVMYLLSIVIGVSATNALTAMYILKLQSTGIILSPVTEPLDSTFPITVSNKQVSITNNVGANRTLHLGIVRIL